MEGAKTADARMPDEFFDELMPFLPVEKSVGRRGGRPAIPHRTVVKVIWFVLVTGCCWEDVPLELGCSGRTAHRRLQRWYARGIWQRLHLHFLTILRKAGVLETQLAVIDSVLVRAFGGGDATGPSPVDRRKLGSKHTLLVDANGVPLVIHTAPANASDYKLILPVVEDFPEIGGKPGRPRKHPDMIYADRGYDSEAILARRASDLSSLVEAPITAAALDGSDGWSNARTVGSRGCGDFGFATTAPMTCKTRGTGSPLQSFATASQSVGASARDRFCQGLLRPSACS